MEFKTESEMNNEIIAFLVDESDELVINATIV